MKPEIKLVVIVITVCLLLIIGVASSKWLGNDNPIEQQIEDIIEKETGVEVDLSPEEEEETTKV